MTTTKPDPASLGSTIKSLAPDLPPPTRLSRWLYRAGRPNGLARILNALWGWLYAAGVAPDYLARLEVRGRRSGRTITFPVVIAVVDGERYLVSMLGNEAAWVRNVHAAEGRARLRHGRGEEIVLLEVPVERRAAILKAYVVIAPGARPHMAIDPAAPLDAFEAVAGHFPVFKIVAL